jgi:hypothetical protein
MSFQLNPVDPTANATFADLVALSNAIVNACATEVVSVNTASNGALTIGNGYVTGIFGATNIVATNLVGGSVANPANVIVNSNLTLNAVSLISGNTWVNSTMVNTSLLQANVANFNYIGVETVAMGNTILQDLSAHQGVGGAPVLLDSWLLTGYRSADYFINIDDNQSNNFGCTRLSVLQGNSSLILITEYAQLYTNGSPVGTFSANANATHVTVWFTTGGSNNANITATKVMLRL